MNPPDSLHESQLNSLHLCGRGKVRDIYDVDEHHLLIVTTDRLSAFDVILPDPIPGKGRILTELSLFWFRQLRALAPNHLADIPLEQILPDPAERIQVEGRAMVVRRLKPLPVEAVVRGYLAGSGWKDYCATGMVCGHRLPSGLQQAERLPQPLYTPSTKAALGSHDENIDFAATVELMGEERAAEVRDLALSIYTTAAAYALQHGIIIADTKFEFGLDEEGRLHWIDEALTPDSSRFWDETTYSTGGNPPSFDKQFVRDYLETLDWNKQSPGPELPQDIIEQTARRYRDVSARLMQH
jgi:phosphoribosylaminoimidazole-succinocarboxamide synthase